MQNLADSRIARCAETLLSALGIARRSQDPARAIRESAKFCVFSHFVQLAKNIYPRPGSYQIAAGFESQICVQKGYYFKIRICFFLFSCTENPWTPMAIVVLDRNLSKAYARGLYDPG